MLQVGEGDEVLVRVVREVLSEKLTLTLSTDGHWHQFNANQNPQIGVKETLCSVNSSTVKTALLWKGVTPRWHRASWSFEDGGRQLPSPGRGVGWRVGSRLGWLIYRSSRSNACFLSVVGRIIIWV